MAQGVPGSLRRRIFLTFRHFKGGRSSAKRTGRLYPRRNPWYSLSEAESTLGHMVLSGVPRKKSPVTTRGNDPGTVRLVAQRLNHYATPGPTAFHTSHHNWGGAGVPLSLWYIPEYKIQGQHPLTGCSIPGLQPPVVTQLLASSTYTAMTHRSISDTGS